MIYRCVRRKFLLDSNNFLEIIKRAALDADEHSQPCDLLFGTVTSAAPLKIRVEQKLELGEAQLILTRNVSDHRVKIAGKNVQNFFFTNDDGDTEDLKPPHVHAIGEIEIEVKNALKAGEQVVMLKQRGGQKFLVLDRRAGM